MFETYEQLGAVKKGGTAKRPRLIKSLPATQMFRPSSPNFYYNITPPPPPSSPPASQRWADVAGGVLNLIQSRRRPQPSEDSDYERDASVGGSASIGFNRDGSLSLGGGLNLSPIVLIGGAFALYMLMSGGSSGRKR